MPILSQIIQCIFIIYFDLLAFFLYYHFNNAISHSITFPVAQNTTSIAHTSYQWLLTTLLHPLCFHNKGIYSHVEPMIPLQTLAPPLSFPAMTLSHNVCHRMWCQNRIYIHFSSCIYKTLLTFRMPEEGKKLQNTKPLYLLPCYVQCRSITYKKSYFTLSYNGNSAQFQLNMNKA